MKEINFEIITAQERNEYFKEKMEILKENLEEDLEQLDCGIDSNKRVSSPKFLNGSINRTEQQLGSKSPQAGSPGAT